MLLALIASMALVVGITVSCKMRGGADLYDFNARRALPLRGIAALMVVFYHVACNVREEPILNHFLCFGDIAVGLFFFMSGYGLMVSYCKKGDNYLQGFLRHRFAKLLPPFLIATIGYEIYQSFQDGHSTLDSITAIVHGGTMLPDSWFVITIIVYYLLFYVCARLFHKPSALVIALWFATAGYIAFCYSLGWEQYWYKIVCAINLGFTYALLEGGIKRILTHHRSVLLGSAWIIALLILGLILLHVQLPIFFLIPLLVVLSVYAMGMWRNRVLEFLGTISYEIYLMQCIWRHKLYETASVHWSVYLVLTLVFTIATAWLLHLFCDKFIKSSSRT